jgi:hypothetical protein
MERTYEFENEEIDKAIATFRALSSKIREIHKQLPIFWYNIIIDCCADEKIIISLYVDKNTESDEIDLSDFSNE